MREKGSESSTKMSTQCKRDKVKIFSMKVHFCSTGRYGNVKGNARPANNEGRGEFIVGFAGVPCKTNIEYRHCSISIVTKYFPHSW